MKQDKGMVLSREEIYYLMNALGARAMIGLGAAENDPVVLKRGRESLMQRGLVTTETGGDRINEWLLLLVTTSFFPQGALTVVRDLPEIGKQVLLFFRRDQSMVLHTFPEQFSHRLAPLDGLEQIIDLLLRWFPLTAYPQSESNLMLTTERFEELRDKAEAHQKDAALQVLSSCTVSDEEKRNLIEAIENRTISGSFAVMQCEGDTITQAYSIAVVAGPSTAWLISQPEDDPQGTHLLIRRIGAEFEAVVADLVQRL